MLITEIRTEMTKMLKNTSTTLVSLRNIDHLFIITVWLQNIRTCLSGPDCSKSRSWIGMIVADWDSIIHPIKALILMIVPNTYNILPNWMINVQQIAFKRYWFILYSKLTLQRSSAISNEHTIMEVAMDCARVWTLITGYGGRWRYITPQSDKATYSFDK